MLLILVIVLGKTLSLVKGDVCPLFEPSTCELFLYNKGSATANQLVIFGAKAKVPIAQLKSTGKPIAVVKEIGSLADVNLITDDLYLETISSLVHENTPARVVHAKGGGAFGYFEVTHNVTDVINVDMFNKIGKITSTVVRFSPMTAWAGDADTVRDIKGFAIKFKTLEGNFDMVAQSSEVFSIKDPGLFASFTHSVKRNPQTFKKDPNMQWDFALNHPETLFFYLKFYSDVGIPCSYTKMPGYPVHTFSFCNNKGKQFYGRFRIKPDAGIEGMTSKEGTRIAGENPDYLIQDLYDRIARGKYPSWTISLQTLDEKAVKQAPFNVFDSTLDLPEHMFPPRPIGKLYLNVNPGNYFRDIERLAFNPSNLVSGLIIRDKLFEGRAIGYRFALDYRIGPNHNLVPVNHPIVEDVAIHTYLRDGREPWDSNGKDAPNYFPNSFNGPVPKGIPKCPKDNMKIDIDPKPTNYKQAAEFFNGLSIEEQKRTVQNMVDSLSLTADFLKKKAVEEFSKIDFYLGVRIAAGLKAIEKTCNKTHK